MDFDIIRKPKNYKSLKTTDSIQIQINTHQLSDCEIRIDSQQSVNCIVSDNH